VILPPKFESFLVEFLLNCKFHVLNLRFPQNGLPSGHSVLAFPVNFNVTALIFALFVTFNCNFPRSSALELDVESLVVPSWSRPFKKMFGSARMIETATPFPEATGFSVSTLLNEFVLTLLVATTPEELSNDGLSIAGSSNPLQALKRDLLEYNDVGSAEAA
jgi:hypothetical protein